MININQYLRSVVLRREDVVSFDEYPYNLPAVQHLTKLDFHPKVTYLVGENGTGKSTILEAIAVTYGFNPEGGSKNFNFSTQETHSSLSENLLLIRGAKRPDSDYFLRAESFYNVITNIDELGVNKGYGDISLHTQSHGESFLTLFTKRFRKNGLYILDEPEAALSPAKQLAMLERMHELIAQNCQFIIATHSPILMAYPYAKLYELKNGFNEVNYKDTDHFKIMKQFINSPEITLDKYLD